MSDRSIFVTKTEVRPMPLFYRKPQPLVPVIHDDVRLLQGDYDFAAATNAIPLAVIEFAQAMRHYPIVFSGADRFPVAVLGLGQDNRFVAAGRWAENHYIPAYARRYPFVFAEASADRFALALDMESERVKHGGEAGEALFAEGKPTALTEMAMAFCQEFHGAHLQTRAFLDALDAAELLVPQQADAKLPNGEPRSLAGFLVIDREKFAGLPDATVFDWHRQGWLALAHFHFASLDRFLDLLARENDSTEHTAETATSSVPDPAEA